MDVLNLRTFDSNQTLIVKGNQPLLLNDSQKIWLLQSGSVAVFAVTLNDGIPEGTRRYLFSVEPGEALFGMATPSEDEPKSLLAVSVEAATVCQLEIEDFIQPNNDDQKIQYVSQNLIALVAKWIERFSIFPGVVNPSSILDTSKPQTWETLQSHLDQLHGDFRRRLGEIEQEEHTTKLTQFEERIRLNTQVTTSAIGELASILKPQIGERFQGETPLLIAAGAVGRAMGIQINPPAKSEDLNRVKEPVDAVTRASRIRFRRVILAGKWWQTNCGPLLAYTQENKRPVALLPTKRSGDYQVFDPETGTRTKVNSSKAQELAPVAYMFYRSFPDKAIKVLDMLRFVFGRQSWDLILLLLLGTAATVVGMLTPIATAILIDNAIPDANQVLLLQIGLALLAASLGETIFELSQGLLTLRLQTVFDSTTQAAVWDRLLKLRVSFFRAFSTGDLKSRVSAITQIRQKLSDKVMRTLLSSFFSLLNLGLLFVYSTQLAWVAVAVALVAIIFTAISGIITRQNLRPLEELSGEIFGLTVQLINGVSKLRVAGAENRAFADWSKKYTQQLKLTLSTQLVDDLLTAFNTVLPTISNILIFSLAVVMLTQSQGEEGAGLSTGVFLAFLSAFGTFLAGATDLSNTLIEVLDIGILWERAQPILQAEPEIDLDKVDPGRLSGHIKLDHVKFRYRQDGPLNLDDVTIEAAAGEFIALVGPSGCGKSTTIRLIMGFDTPEEGTVYFDGQDLAGLDVSAVRRQLGVVLQNGRINSGPIFENIGGGALITVDEAWEAARMAGFADDIEAMPMGMHTVVSEGGTNLSGGQRQRLLIARALVLKPRILIFDEATSALDNRTQAIVSESIDRLRVTRIVIAHRLSTIRNADRIYVMEAGRVVEQGTFEELAAQPGLFANLIARQMA
jgi:NHLM bacteriocin system ABC transporter ATP-binding protein